MKQHINKSTSLNEHLSYDLVRRIFLKKKNQRMTKTIFQLVFRCGQQSSQLATTSSMFDRKATRNPQLHIIPNVMGNTKETMYN